MQALARHNQLHTARLTKWILPPIKIHCELGKYFAFIVVFGVAAAMHLSDMARLV